MHRTSHRRKEKKTKKDERINFNLKHNIISASMNVSVYLLIGRESIKCESID